MNRFPWEGIQIRVHPLFWVVIILSLVTGQFVEVITLFVLVVIHELGHITADWTFEWRFRSLELLPVGGVAKTDEWGTVPAHEEIVVALAGPFHNVMMIIIGYLFFMMGWWSEVWTTYFVQGNVMLAVFNLLPAYPLDGGKVLQAALSYRIPYRKCIVWSLSSGLLVGGGLFAWELLSPTSGMNLNLIVIAVFLLYHNWIALRQKEYQYIRFLMSRQRGKIPEYAPVIQLPVYSDEPLISVVKRWYKEAYHVLVVTDRESGQVAAIPEEAVLHRYFDEGDPRCQVGELLH